MVLSPLKFRVICNTSLPEYHTIITNFIELLSGAKKNNLA